jgi:hypothetical protein
MSSNPYLAFLDSFRQAYSGDLNQRIVTSWLSPSVTVNYGGNFEIERRVVSDVASFGKQIGWLSEIVEALASRKPVPARTLDRLREAMAEIEEIKSQVRKSAETEAAEALDRLAREEPDGLRRFLEKRLQDLPAPKLPEKNSSGTRR